MKTNIDLTLIYVYITNCDKTFTIIAFFFIINVVEKLVTNNTFVNIENFVKLLVD